MKRRWPWICMLLPPAFASGYMAWLTWTAQADSKWMFVVLAFFFLALMAAVVWPRRVEAAKTLAPEGTRFAPHWGLMFGGLMLVVFLIAVAVSLFRR